ncbi:DedA family protein [Campylobacter hepaticus]|uniref:DedA family protein n=1 Tax=Campylobacter hepaticus TaxID=1813019 RepID=A0A424Z346_9BACT|nr:YqaA family protein [Campylobacter hepaticus]MCZ0772816.1 DedA family protein [Campylobacter hepaticus]MCZ0774285.1 DedA family protein [Campylobacter hepaticus]MCZ0775537.1 DedA family protein [Campylobacter hepaticus]MDX2323180.1 DedA family protein [Campylobacter hepaticus]MDX2331028.1 DedA family protein [Campylobacter hepaticus]
MFDFLYNDISYLGLFIVSFLSSTLLPLASEAFVLGFIKLQFNPIFVLLIATLGNSLGSLSTYALAYYGKEKILEKYFSQSLKKLEKFNINYTKFGSIFAFLSFLPLVGDLFALGLGFAKYSFLKSAFFISLGKLSRYAFIIFIANSL